MPSPCECICTACHQPCHAHWADFGIGHYEYWGHVAFDSDRDYVSTCCDAPLLLASTEEPWTSQDQTSAEYAREEDDAYDRMRERREEF